MPDEKKIDLSKLKLSELLRLAVKDAQKAENDPRYRLKMDVWHSPNGTCAVCLAGSVMAFTLGANPKKYLEWSDFEGPIARALCAIDSMRSGNIYDAVEDLVLDMDLDERAEPIEESIRDGYDPVLGRASWDTYLKAADEMESIGI